MLFGTSSIHYELNPQHLDPRLPCWPTLGGPFTLRPIHTEAHVGGKDCGALGGHLVLTPPRTPLSDPGAWPHFSGS